MMKERFTPRVPPQRRLDRGRLGAAERDREVSDASDRSDRRRHTPDDAIAALDRFGKQTNGGW